LVLLSLLQRKIQSSNISRNITDQSQGDNGVGPGSYSQALFQYVLTGAGWDPAVSPIQKGNCGSAGCVVAWGSGTRSVASVVLIANGICFAVMTVMFVGLGSAADYGSFGRWLLLVLTVICWVFQYCMMAIRTPNQWPAAMALYIVAYIAYVSQYNSNLYVANTLQGCYACFLCCVIPATGSIYATRQESQRGGLERPKDQPS